MDIKTYISNFKAGPSAASIPILRGAAMGGAVYYGLVFGANTTTAAALTPALLVGAASISEKLWEKWKFPAIGAVSGIALTVAAISLSVLDRSGLGADIAEKAKLAAGATFLANAQTQVATAQPAATINLPPQMAAASSNQAPPAPPALPVAPIASQGQALAQVASGTEITGEAIALSGDTIGITTRVKLAKVRTSPIADVIYDNQGRPFSIPAANLQAIVSKSNVTCTLTGGAGDTRIGGQGVDCYLNNAKVERTKNSAITQPICSLYRPTAVPPATASHGEGPLRPR